MNLSWLAAKRPGIALHRMLYVTVKVKLTDDDAHDLPGPEGVDQPHREGDQSHGDEHIADVVLQQNALMSIF